MAETGTEACLVASFIAFLEQKRTEDNAESIEIVIQCLMGMWPEASDANTVSLLELVGGKTAGENKEEAEAWKRKGNDALAAKQYEEALKCYTKAVELCPSNSVYFCNRAATYSFLGKDALAVEDCKLAVKLDPLYCKAWTRLGLAYFNLHQYSQSVEAYERAKTLEPNNHGIEQGLSLAKEKLKSSPTASSSPSGTPDLSKLLSDPNMMDMAKNLMNSGALNDLLKNPAISQMASSLFGGANNRPGSPQ